MRPPAEAACNIAGGVGPKGAAMNSDGRTVLAVLAAAVCGLIGCTPPTYTAVGNLPNPPPLTDSLPAPASQPADAAPAAATHPVSDSPAGWAPAVRELPWKYIVVHHSSTKGGNAANFDAFHRSKNWDELGYHFVIDNGNGGPDGAVEVGSRWAKQKWGAHTGGTPNNEYNNYGIGICLVGDFNTHMPTARQLESLERLVGFLMARYDIQPGCIIGHRDAPGANTDCPGDRLHAWLFHTFRPRMAERLAIGR